MEVTNHVNSFWGMHAMWWFFWFGMMALTFGFNLPDQVRIPKNDPHSILRRRFASGELTEEEYEKMISRLDGNNLPIRKTLVIENTTQEYRKHPIIDGLSFSVSWIILYSLCALAYWISPEIVTVATSKLFHGMSFTQMQQQAAPFNFSDFLSVLTIGAFYVFIAGALTSTVHSYLNRKRNPKAEHNTQEIKSRLRPQTR